MNAHRLPARHYSTSGFQRLSRNTTSPPNGQQSSSIQALDLRSAPELDISSALASLRIHVLGYLSDLEARLALLDFKSQSALRADNKDFLTISSSKAASPSSSSSSSAAGDESDGSEDVEVEEVVLDGYDLDLNSDDVAEFIRNGLHLLETIRADVTSYLPDVDFTSTLPSAAAASRENLRRRLNELGISPLKLHLELANKLPEFEIPSMPTMPTIPSMPSMDSLRNKLSEFEFDPSGHLLPIVPLSYIPKLKAHLTHLQEHMQELPSCFSAASSSEGSAGTASFPFQIGLTPPKIVTDILSDLLEEDTEEAIEADIKKAEAEAVSTTEYVKQASLKSRYGKELINFEDLPPKWKNNEFVKTGYRFIPSRRWPALLFSMFEFHNETTNIHTHLIPLLSIVPLLITLLGTYVLPSSYTFLSVLASPFQSLSQTYFPLSSSTSASSWAVSQYLSITWPFSLLPSFLPSSFLQASHSSASELFAKVGSYVPVLLPANPELDALPASFFTFSAACCLFSSVLWHIFSGCSDQPVMESAARGDYVGIGWLISASVQSVVFYGFNCQTTALRMYTALCLGTGLAGSIVPFQAWFDQRRNKKWRIVFFLGLAFASVLPTTHLAFSKGIVNTFFFILPVLYSCALYIIGLVFYAFHIPECFFPGKFDYACSHAVWHIFIVLAIRSHYMAMMVIKEASGEFACGL